MGKVRNLAIYDYAAAILGGVVNAGVGFFQAVVHPIDNVLYPLAMQVHDASVFVIRHMDQAGMADPIRGIDPDMAMAARVLASQNQIYKDAKRRLIVQMEAVHQAGHAFADGSGPYRAGQIAQGVAGLAIPGGVMKAVNAVANKFALGVAHAPKFKPGANVPEVIPPEITRIGPRQAPTAPSGGLPSASAAAEKFIQPVSVQDFWNKGALNESMLYVLTEQNQLFLAAKELAQSFRLSNAYDGGLAAMYIDHTNLAKQLMVFAAGEARIIEKPIGWRYANGEWGPMIERALRVNNKAPGYAPNGPNLDKIVREAFRQNGFPNARNPKFFEFHNVNFPNVQPGLNAVMDRPFLQGLPVGAVLQAAQAPAQAPGLGAAAAQQVYRGVAEQLMRNDHSFQARNPYFVSQNQPKLASYLPNWHQILYQEQLSKPLFPSSFDIWKIEQEIRSRMGPGLLTLAADFAIRHFALNLALSGVSKSYNEFHSLGMNAWYADWGSLGGVAHKTAIIEDPNFESHPEHVLVLKEGKMPFQSRELQLIMDALRKGIKKGTFPFFSLHFNQQRHQYPVLHPCYDGIVGEVMGFLDFFMKGYLNGGYYSKKFLQEWPLNPNSALPFLRKHLIDLKKLDPDYQSLNEILCMKDLARVAEPHGLSPYDVRAQDIRTAFWIEAKQNSISMEGNVIVFDPGFDVNFKMFLPAKYEKYLEQYKSEHGSFPDDFTELVSVFRHFANKIRTDMPKLPGMEPYFQKLGVINLLCYYIRTQEALGREVVVQAPNDNVPAFPKILPPLPLRYYEKRPITLTLEEVLQQVGPAIRKEVDLFLYQYYWDDSEKEFSQGVHEAFFRAIHDSVSKQLGTHDLDKKKIDKLTEKCFQRVRDISLEMGNTFHTSLVKGCNQLILNILHSVDSDPEPASYVSLKLSEGVLEHIETGRVKGFYIHDQMEKAKAAIRPFLTSRTRENIEKLRTGLFKELQSEPLLDFNKVSALIEQKVQSARQAAEEQDAQNMERFELACTNNEERVERVLHRTTENMLEISLENPGAPKTSLIESDYLHSMLSVATEQEVSHVVGGCQFNLNAITPQTLAQELQGVQGAEILSQARGMSYNEFTRLQIQGQDYHAFKIAARDIEEEEEKYSEEDEVQRLIETRGYSPLKIAALQGPAALSRALSQHPSNTDPELPNNADAPFLTVLSGDEEGTLLLLNSKVKFDINHPAEDDVTLLHLAIDQKLKGVASRLIEMKANLHVRRRKDDYAPIHLAAHYGQWDVIEKMLEQGQNINARVPGDKTPLHIAAEQGLDPTFLIAHGADSTAQDDKGNTPLQTAIAAGYREVALALAQYTPLGLKNKQGETASLTAARHALFDVADVLLGRGEDKKSWTRDKEGLHFPYYIARHGHVDGFLHYEKRMPKNSYEVGSLLTTAIFCGHRLMARYLSKKLKEKNIFGDLKRVVAMDDADYLKTCNIPIYQESSLIEVGLEQGSESCLPLLLRNYKNYTANTCLKAAIRGGNISVLRTLWEHIGPSMSSWEFSRNQSVHEAVRCGRMEILKALYSFGFKIDGLDDKGRTPYQLADQFHDDEMKAWLKKKGAVPKDALKEAALVPPQPREEATKEEVTLMTRQLLRGHLVANARKASLLYQGAPLLHSIFALKLAQSNFILRATRSIKNLGTDPLIKTKYGKPLSFVLLNCKNEEEVKEKLKLIKAVFPEKYEEIISQTNDDKQDVCDVALRRGHPYVIKAMNHRPSPQSVHYACKGGDAKTLRSLLYSTDINAFDEKIYTPLHYAAELGHLNLVKMLLDRDPISNVANRDGDLPLHLAIKNNHSEVALLLIDNLPKCDVANRQGITPFMLAAMKGLVPVITRLKPLSNRDALDKQGMSALHWAALVGSLTGVKQLIKTDGDIPAMDVNVGAGAAAEGVGIGGIGCTPLFYAAYRGHLEVFRFLLEKGADITRVGSNKTTVLDAMVSSKSELMEQELKNIPMFYQKRYQRSLPMTAAMCGNLPVLQRLFLMTVPLNLYSAHGYASLHGAVTNDKYTVVDFLLEHGCAPDQPLADGSGKTALDLAKTERMEKKLRDALAKPRTPIPIIEVATLPDTEDLSLPGNAAPKTWDQGSIPGTTQGLTWQESAKINGNRGHAVTPAFYALAVRVKQEFGMKGLIFFSGKKASQASDDTVMQTMTLFLNASDVGLIKAAVALPTFEEMNAFLLGSQTRELNDKMRPAKEMLTRFLEKNETLPEPLLPEGAQKIAGPYQQMLDHSNRLAGVSHSELIQIARTSQDQSEVVAVIRLMMMRQMKISPHDTQLFALFALIEPDNGDSAHEIKGRLAQIQTGEGKSTIIAMMSTYFALQGETVDVVTTTQSLARRDQAKYALLYRSFGIESSHIALRNPQKFHFRGQIIYGSIKNFEFHELNQHNGHKMDQGEESPREPRVVIIDEVDYFFMEGALSSARISKLAPHRDRSWLCKPLWDWAKQQFVWGGWRGYDPITIRAVLNQVDAEKCQLLDDDELKMYYYAARRARFECRENVDYHVKDQIIIVDYQNTGCPFKGTRWQDGLHEFLELKHNLPIKPTSATVGAISHAAFLRRYKRVVGLSGTLGGPVERQELKEHGLELFDVPSHLPNKRTEQPPLLFKHSQNYYNAIKATIQEMRQAGRPILILLESIKDTLEMSKYLQKQYIDHQVLNGVQQEGERYLLKKAGMPKAVTLATSIAGRGTDIILTDESVRKGGLHVAIGFLPRNKRVEQQNKGRAGRQGQVGSCQMIVDAQSAASWAAVLGLHVPGEGELTPAGMAKGWETLFAGRESLVQKASLERQIRVRNSFTLYDIFTDFSRIRQQVKASLEETPLDRSQIEDSLVKQWEDFFPKIERRSLDQDAITRAYNDFLNTKIKPLLASIPLEERAIIEEVNDVKVDS